MRVPRWGGGDDCERERRRGSSPDDYKEYIKYISDIKNYKTYKEYDFTESCKTDINFLLLNIKKYFKELKIKKYEIKFKHQKYTERGFNEEIKYHL